MQDLEIVNIKYYVMEFVPKFKLVGKLIFFLLCFVTTVVFFFFSG